MLIYIFVVFLLFGTALQIFVTVKHLIKKAYPALLNLTTARF